METGAAKAFAKNKSDHGTMEYIYSYTIMSELSKRFVIPSIQLKATNTKIISRSTITTTTTKKG
jgi:hypothetical protein